MYESRYAFITSRYEINKGRKTRDIFIKKMIVLEMNELPVSSFVPFFLCSFRSLQRNIIN